MSSLSTRFPAVLGMLAAAAALIVLAIALSRDGTAHRALAQQPPLNDNFERRDYWYEDYYQGGELFPLDRTYSTAGATLEQGESAPCGPIGATVWIEYRADRSGTLHLSAVGDTFDAILAVYTWDMSGDFLPSPPGAKLQPVACADQGTPNQGLSISILRDTQYLIQVGGHGSGGIAHVTAACDCPPPNDNFSRPQELYVDAYTPETRRAAMTRPATLEPGEPRPCGDIGATVWYTLYQGSAADIDLTTVGSDFDTVLAVYTPTNYTGSLDDLKLVQCVDTGAGGSEQASLLLRTGAAGQYFIQAGGKSGAGGQLHLAAKCSPVCPPYNDALGQASYWQPPILGLASPTTGATLEPGEPRPCGNMDATVWFAISAPGDTRIAIDTEGSDFATVMAVYSLAGFSPPPGSFHLINCDASSSSGRAHVEFEANANTTYWLQIGGRNGASGQLVLNADCAPSPCPPSNDGIASPYYLGRPTPQPYPIELDVRGATTEAREPLNCGNMRHTTWWVIDVSDPQPTFTFVLDTAGSDFDTAIAVYEAPLYAQPPFADLHATKCDAGGPGARARAVFTAASGKRLFIQTGGRGDASGTLHLSFTCQEPCPPDNDNANGAYPNFPFGLVQTFDTRGATMEAGEPQPCGSVGKTVWFHLDSPQGGAFTISTEGSDFPTVIAVYKIAWVSPPGGFENVTCVSGNRSELNAGADSYFLVQVGGVDGAGGTLQIRMDCSGSCGPYPVLPGGAATGSGGSIAGPDTGSGGYLSGATGQR